MVTAFVMIKTHQPHSRDRSELADKDGITQAYSATGAWDLIAM